MNQPASEIAILRAALQDIINGAAEAAATSYRVNPPAWYVGNMGARAKAALIEADELVPKCGYYIEWELGACSGVTEVNAANVDAAEAYFDCYMRPAGYVLMGVTPA